MALQDTINTKLYLSFSVCLISLLATFSSIHSAFELHLHTKAGQRNSFKEQKSTPFQSNISLGEFFEDDGDDDDEFDHQPIASISKSTPIDYPRLNTLSKVNTCTCFYSTLPVLFCCLKI
jgi:hypothetical protein